MVSYLKASSFPGEIYTLVDKSFINWVLDIIEINGYEFIEKKTSFSREFIDDIILGNIKVLNDKVVDELIVASKMDKNMGNFSWFSKEQLLRKNINV